MSLYRTRKVLCAAVSLFAFTCVSSQEQQIEKFAQVPKTDTKNEQGSGKGHDSKSLNQSPPPSVPAISAKAPSGVEQPIAQTKPDREQKNDRKEESWFSKLFADPIAFFTLLLFMATFALWWATRRLVGGAEESSQRQLRAYVSGRPDFIFDFGPKQLAGMRYTIENHGQTPAYSIQHVAVVAILPYPLPIDFQLPSLPPFMPASLTLHPRETIFGTVFAQRLFTTKEISDAAANNGCRIYCFGSIKYESFGSIRTTKFCRSIIGSENLLAVGSGETKEEVRLDYDITSQHNEAN